MDEKVAEILALAFRSVPASQANEAIDAVRAEEGAGGESIRSYELLVPPDAGEKWLIESAVPRLVYHLESLRARPPQFGGVVLSLFAGEKLHFVRAAEFLPAVARLANISIDELYARHGTGELRTATSSAANMLALPLKLN